MGEYDWMIILEAAPEEVSLALAEARVLLPEAVPLGSELNVKVSTLPSEAVDNVVLTPRVTDSRVIPVVAE